MPESIIQLQSVEPDNIPATAVTGEPVVTGTSDGVVELDVPTDAGAVHLVVVQQPDARWLVRSWTPKEG